MKITPTKIKEILIIEPDVFGDDRGWFYESYNKHKLKELGIDVNFIQDNHSYNLHKGILRGLHFQNDPNAQTKLIRCTRGRVLDIVVDLRKGSSTFKKWVKVELSDKNKKQLFIPKGFGHGFLTLTDNVEFQYKVDEHYVNNDDRSIRFDDPELNIDWGIKNPILSDKDMQAPYLRDSDVNFVYQEGEK